MGWICRVCGKEAKYVYEFGTSLINKRGYYNVHKRGYCEEHKPIIDKQKHLKQSSTPTHKLVGKEGK